MSQTVGCEYPISTSSKMYISQSHARWLQRNSPTYILLPWVGMIYPIHDISHTHMIYPIQTIDKYSLNSRLPISNTNLYFPHPWTGCIICILYISLVCPLYAHHIYPISFLHKMHIHFSGHRTNWWIIYSHYISTFCLHL